ncbi:MAG: hypothetical protein LBD04_10715 [Synergistaceae bacterium]|nr:hypothetical protein [Synergistaceae bacterium]
MIINIHGFGGEGNNSKYRWLCENFPRHAIYSPTFHYGTEEPGGILEHLKNKAEACRRENPGSETSVYVVGNSLGGFFAWLLNQAYPRVPAILINPSLVPFLNLWDRIPERLCRMYLKLTASRVCEEGGGDRLHVIVGDADEHIDHERMTRPMLPTHFKNLHVIKGGTHQLEMTPETETVFRTVIQAPEGPTEGNGDSKYLHYHGERKLP